MNYDTPILKMKVSSFPYIYPFFVGVFFYKMKQLISIIKYELMNITSRPKNKKYISKKLLGMFNLNLDTWIWKNVYASMWSVEIALQKKVRE